MSQSLENLIYRFISGDLDEEGLAELERILESDPQQRLEFLDHTSLHNDLYTVMRADRLTGNIIEALTRSSGSSEQGASSVLPAKVKRFPFWTSVLLSLACCLLFVVWLVSQPNDSSDKPKALAKRESPSIQQEPSVQDKNSQDTSTDTVDAVATLYDTDDAVWKNKSVTLGHGSRLGAGERLRLVSGLAELAFKSGVEVLLEGPAEIKLLSDMELVLLSGRLTADVPKDAIGFSVRTETARIMDLGTVFGVNVDSDRNSEVIVFDGEVLLSSQSLPEHRRLIKAGSRVRTSEYGGIETLSQPDVAPFIRSLDRQLVFPEGEVVANYRRDFQPSQPNQEIQRLGLRYLWNASGPLGNPQHYEPLTWNGDVRYGPTGAGQFPAGDPAFSLHLRAYGGHPGRDASGSQVHDFGHGPVVAFSVPADGQYAIIDSWLSRFDTRAQDEVDSDNEFGLDVLVHVNDQAPLLQETSYGGGKFTFDTELGQLQKGDTIYIAIGPNQSSRYDTFHWNFSIVRRERHTTDNIAKARLGASTL